MTQAQEQQETSTFINTAQSEAVRTAKANGKPTIVIETANGEIEVVYPSNCRLAQFMSLNGIADNLIAKSLWDEAKRIHNEASAKLVESAEIHRVAERSVWDSKSGTFLIDVSVARRIGADPNNANHRMLVEQRRNKALLDSAKAVERCNVFLAGKK